MSRLEGRPAALVLGHEGDGLTRDALDACVGAVQRAVTGRVRMRLHGGVASTVETELTSGAARLRTAGLAS